MFLSSIHMSSLNLSIYSQNCRYIPANDPESNAGPVHPILTSILSSIYLINPFTWLTEVCKIPSAQTKPMFCFTASKPTCSLHLCFSKCDPWITSISITWELVRHANSLPHRKPTESEHLGMRLSKMCFNTFSRQFWCLLKSRTTAPDNSGSSKGSLPFLCHPVGLLLPSVPWGILLSYFLSFHIHVLGPSPRLGLLISYRDISLHIEI